MIEKELDARWDMHTDRQIAAAKGGAIAITALNSGSWLALLSQAASLDYIGPSILLWGTGAGLGTLLWLFIYLSAILQWEHDLDRLDEAKAAKLDRNNKIGFAVAVLAILCFAAGAVALAVAVW